MSQSVVTIRLNGHPYQIGCEVGEEEHVAKLGQEVESVLQSLVKSAGQIGEARLLAMVAPCRMPALSIAVRGRGACLSCQETVPPASDRTGARGRCGRPPRHDLSRPRSSLEPFVLPHSVQGYHLRADQVRLLCVRSGSQRTRTNGNRQFGQPTAPV